MTDDLDRRLVNISTLWSVVRAAHHGADPQARAAQQQLLDRYGGAVRRYLLGCLRDGDAAEELFQEFAVSFLNGNFRNANPDRGRFRDYVKTALFHLIGHYQRKRNRGAKQMADDAPEPAAMAESLAEMDGSFLASWREDLLARAWAAVDAAEAAGGPPYGSVLRFRTAHPDLASPDLAERFGAELGKSMTAAGIRQLLHRARESFADVLVDQVAQSMGTPSAEELVDELIVMNLYDYCKPAVERRQEAT